MSQIIGDTANTTGIQIALGAGRKGQILILTGSGDPNSISDSAYIGVTSAAVGSLFLRNDGSTNTTLYVKTALPNTWTAK